MNPYVYDASMAVGLGLSTYGVYLMAGSGPALVFSGLLVIVLTSMGARR